MSRFSDEEMREIERLNREITVTDLNSQKPYVFISYKSDDRLQMLRIVHRLNTVYGLRVYYDKAFAVNNELWITQMEQNMSSAFCYGMLLFLTKKYYRSYAACMEVMHSHTSKCLKKRRKEEKEYLPLVPINLERAPSFSDEELDSDTGLLQSNEQNLNAEKVAFLRYYKQLEKTIPGFNYYVYDNNSSVLTVEDCSEMIKAVYEYANINDNRFYESSFDSFCNTIAENIHNSVYKIFENNRITVFDDEKYHRAIQSFDSGQRPAVPAPQPVSVKPAVTAGAQDPYETSNTEPVDNELFWKEFMEYAFRDESFAAQFRRRNPSKDQTMNFSTGTSQCKIIASRRKRDNSIGCELYFPKEKELFNKLYDMRLQIEADTGTAFEWISQPDKKSSYIMLSQVFSSGGAAGKYVWLKEKMLLMKELLSYSGVKLTDQSESV